MYIPFQQIADQLELKENDTLLIASDISKLAFASFKQKEKFDGNLFITSFQKKLSEGTLLFPAFLHTFKSGDVFDPSVASPEMGSLSVTAFGREDFQRNEDPVHSFLVSGKRKEEIASIKPISTFGEGSVFADLHRSRAKMLLIDVDLQHSFTFAHYVEEKWKVDYRKFKEVSYFSIDPGGNKQNEKIKVFSKKRGVLNTLNKLEELFIAKNAIKKTEINGSFFRLIDLEIAFRIIEEDIKLNKAKTIHSFDKKEFIRSTVKKVLGK